MDSAALLERHKATAQEAIAAAEDVAGLNRGLMAALPKSVGPSERAVTAALSGFLAGGLNGVIGLTGWSEIIIPLAEAGLGMGLQFTTEDPDWIEVGAAVGEGAGGYASGVFGRETAHVTMGWISQFMKPATTQPAAPPPAK